MLEHRILQTCAKSDVIMLLLQLEVEFPELVKSPATHHDYSSYLQRNEFTIAATGLGPLGIDLETIQSQVCAIKI